MGRSAKIKKESVLSPRSDETLRELNALTTVCVVLNDGRQIILPLTEKLDEFIAKRKEEVKKERARKRG